MYYHDLEQDELSYWLLYNTDIHTGALCERRGDGYS